MPSDARGVVAPCAWSIQTGFSRLDAMHRGISRQAAQARALADIAASELAGLTPEQIEVLGLVGDFAEEMEKEARALEAVSAAIGAA